MGHVSWLVRHVQLTGVKLGARYWVEPQSATARASDRSWWISMVDAAELAGCSTATISNAAQRGEITQRKRGRAYPSLDRESVLEWAEHQREAWEQEQARKQALKPSPADRTLSIGGWISLKSPRYWASAASA